MKKLLIVVWIVLVGLQSCNSKKEESNTKIETEVISELSVFNLPSEWTTQDNKHIEIKELKGNVLVMVMIYTSCKTACPRLVADMRQIEQLLPEKYKSDVCFLLISIDPKTDTPERLKAFAIKNKMMSKQWLFLQSTEENTREFAAVLGVNYKKIAPIDFSHSNIISVFNKKGELVFQQEGFTTSYDTIVSKIIGEVSKAD
ncbi:MAG: SCO family protein [Flavobacterium sp.]|nr:SCO family protein [Flavobacterium sp.]